MDSNDDKIDFDDFEFFPLPHDYQLNRHSVFASSPFELKLIDDNDISPANVVDDNNTDSSEKHPTVVPDMVVEEFLHVDVNTAKAANTAKAKNLINLKKPIKALFKIKRIVKYLLIVGFLCVIILISKFLSVYSRLNFEDIDLTQTARPAEEAPKWLARSQVGVTNILLLGIDGDGGDNQRSDTIMLLTLDRSENKIKLTSILRDTYVFIPGKDKMTRINHAYSYGGVALTMKTIESNFRIKLDKYVSIDLEGLTALINDFGGVDLLITSAEADVINKNVKNTNISDGYQHLNGEQAVYYARIRKIDSDFERTGRQRKLIKALIEQIKPLTFSQKYAMVEQTAPYISTNLSKLDFINAIVNVSLSLDNDVDEMFVPAKGTYQAKRISNMAVLVPDIPSNCELMHRFIFGGLPIW